MLHFSSVFIIVRNIHLPFYIYIFIKLYRYTDIEWVYTYEKNKKNVCLRFHEKINYINCQTAYRYLLYIDMNVLVKKKK